MTITQDPERAADGWLILPLTELQTEVLVHMSIKRAAPVDELLRDVWTTTDRAEAVVELESTVALINAAATAATGKPGNVIDGPGDTAGTFGAVRTPEIYLHIMGEVYVEVR